MSNIIKVTLCVGGRTVSSIAALDDDLIANSRGPMALYSACLGVLREVCQALYARSKALEWSQNTVFELLGKEFEDVLYDNLNDLLVKTEPK
jgi:hypothetical protein